MKKEDVNQAGEDACDCIFSSHNMGADVAISSFYNAVARAMGRCEAHLDVEELNKDIIKAAQKSNQKFGGNEGGSSTIKLNQALQATTIHSPLTAIESRLKIKLDVRNIQFDPPEPTPKSTAPRRN